MDLVVADNSTVPYMYLLNVVVAEEDLNIMKYVSKPEGSQKEQEAVGGRGRPGGMKGSPPLPLVLHPPHNIS